MWSLSPREAIGPSPPQSETCTWDWLQFCWAHYFGGRQQGEKHRAWGNLLLLVNELKLAPPGYYIMVVLLNASTANIQIQKPQGLMVLADGSWCWCWSDCLQCLSCSVSGQCWTQYHCDRQRTCQDDSAHSGIKYRLFLPSQPSTIFEVCLLWVIYLPSNSRLTSLQGNFIQLSPMWAWYKILFLERSGMRIPRSSVMISRRRLPRWILHLLYQLSSQFNQPMEIQLVQAVLPACTTLSTPGSPVAELAVTWGPFTVPAYFPTSFKCSIWESLAWFVYFLPMLAELNWCLSQGSIWDPPSSLTTTNVCKNCSVVGSIPLFYCLFTNI